MASGRQAAKNATAKKKQVAQRKVKSHSAERVRKHRAKMRRAGMKLVQIWVPDPAQPGFAEEVRRQCLRVRDDPQEKQILAEIEAVADFEGWK